jgi:hypothetical protein
MGGGDMRKQLYLELAIALALTALALSVRLYRLPEIPIGLYNDEAANGVDILDILNGQHPIFFERNNGREPLFIYLQAIAVACLGATPFALRLTAAIIGAITVPAVYWMTREAFAKTEPRSRMLAVWTALFVALSYWHITFSRLGFRAIMLPLLASITFAWFWRAWRRLETGRQFPNILLILCGISLGITLYTYIAARFVPLVILLVALGGMLQNRQQPGFPRRVLRGIAVIGLTTLVIFMPLALHFLSHPASFIGHSAADSAFAAPKYVNSSLPLTVVSQFLRTIGMFGWLVDKNWRHDPAGQPAFDLLLSAWLFAGVILAVTRWRSLPYLFAIIWGSVLMLPALLSEEAPHFLRMLGVLPAVYLLTVVAMLEAGKRLFRSHRWLAVWLPLPFLLFSGVTGLHDYFTAWQRNTINLRQAFDIRFVEAVPAMLQDPRPDSVWIIPLWPVVGMPPRSYVLDFLTRRRITHDTVRVGEDQSPNGLLQATQGHRFAHLLRWSDAALEPDGTYAIVDRKNLLAFLLEKHGRPISDQSSGNVGYTTYELPASPDYRVAGDEIPTDLSFGNKLKLTSLAYGHSATTRDEPASALDGKRVPSGRAAWAVLRWQAQQPVDNTLKTSLFLVDAAGHLAAQVDNPLLSDLYLYKPAWEVGEQGSTYHILPTLPGVPPGRYQLFLAVYDPNTMQRLPVLDANGSPAGSAALLGSLDIAPPLAAAEVQPSTPLPPATRLGPDLALLGYDLPSRTLKPGDHLPLTLFWRAENQPATDFLARVELQDAQGQPVAQRTLRPGTDAFPTTAWPAGAVLRNWQDLAIPPTTPAGTYHLRVSLLAADQEVGRISLGDVQLRGRPREFAPPAMQHPAAFRLGNDIALLGFDLTNTSVRPGETLNLALFWQALHPVDRSFAVFVHLLAADGHVVAQLDQPPAGGAAPTSSWLPAEYITDPYQLPVNPNTPAGQYRLEIGMYDPATGVRLPVLDAQDRTQTDHVLLPLPVQITPN